MKNLYCSIFIGLALVSLTASIIWFVLSEVDYSLTRWLLLIVLPALATILSLVAFKYGRSFILQLLQPPLFRKVIIIALCVLLIIVEFAIVAIPIVGSF